MVQEKHFFAGNNTSKGFYSYFDYIFKPENATRISILKGGPGVGKSSFMKKLAMKMSSSGYEVEYIHCSADQNSLDAVSVPELKIFLVDGTAPHTIDPCLPGVKDEIINLGVYLNHDEMVKHQEQVIQINTINSQLYESAFRYFAGAGLIEEELASIYNKFTDDNKFYHLYKTVIDKIFSNTSYKSSDYFGKTRKLFTEANTANGYISYTDLHKNDKKVIAITGENTNYSSKLLDLITNEAVNRGFDVLCLYRPLFPDKLQHVIIPGLNLMIMSVDNHYDCNYDEIVNLHEIMNLDNLRNHISEIEKNLNLKDTLLKNATEKLSEAKKYHELLEVIYVNAMDFKGVDEHFEKFYESLF